MFKKYDQSVLKELRNQHNIFVLVGNGFDIASLNRYNEGFMKGRTTSYHDFFDYVKYFKLSDSSNVLLQKMEEDRDNGKDDWSDFENSVYELFMYKACDVNVLERCIDEFQSHFTQYLNTLVDADMLLKFNKDVQDKQLTRQSLEYFLRDLEPGALEFASKTDHYDLFNFVFANFNYTSLLDNYLFLDKKQFDPHKFKVADRNFSFHLNNKLEENHSETVYSSYVLLDVVHPHGVQDIPRSILFGIDLEDYNEGTSPEKRLVKAYWAQYRIKYESYLDKADLFIIYGMSLGKSDAWWMDKIFENILLREVELIIYKYGDKSEDDIKTEFIDSCLRNKNKPESEKNKVREKIRVKTFWENETYFLGFTKLIEII